MSNCVKEECLSYNADTKKCGRGKKCFKTTSKKEELMKNSLVLQNDKNLKPRVRRTPNEQ